MQFRAVGCMHFPLSQPKTNHHSVQKIRVICCHALRGLSKTWTRPFCIGTILDLEIIMKQFSNYFTNFRWILSQTPHRVHQMLQVLNVCIPSFEYRGQKRNPVKRQNTQSFRKNSDMKERLEECIRGTGSARSEFINRRKDRASNDKLRWRKDQMPYRYRLHWQSYLNNVNFNYFWIFQKPILW